MATVARTTRQPKSKRPFFLNSRLESPHSWPAPQPLAYWMKCIVKHIVDLDVGPGSILRALYRYPLKSGLMQKHFVKNRQVPVPVYSVS